MAATTSLHDDRAARDGGDEAPAVLQTLGDLVALQRRVRSLYLRVGHGRVDDTRASWWHAESGYPLPGVAGWPLRAEPWWQAGQPIWIARQLVRHTRQATPWEVPWVFTGTVVGRGADCEPLVADPVPLGLLGRSLLEEARRVHATWRGREFR